MSDRRTSARVASKAARILNDKRSTPREKSVAGSTLSQRAHVEVVEREVASTAQRKCQFDRAAFPRHSGDDSIPRHQSSVPREDSSGRYLLNSCLALGNGCYSTVTK